MKTWLQGDTETWKHGHEDIKRKTEAKAIFLNPLTFAHCANGSLSFVRSFTKKEMEVIHLQTD
jgi:hypothetical protein